MIDTVVVAGVALVVCVILEVLDRVTESPGMRKHVNAGSERFFRERGSIWRSALRSAGEFFDSVGSWF